MTLKALATVVENEAREVLDSSLADLVEGRGLEFLLVLSSWCGLTENDLGMDRMMAGSTMENDATTRNSSPVLLFGTPSHILAQNQSPVNELSEVQTIDQISPEIKKIQLVPPPPSLPNRAEEGERFILNLTELLAPDEELATTAVSVGELVHWATKSQRAADNLARMDVLSLKENQGHLFEDVQLLFDDLEKGQYKADAFDYHKTVNKNHGCLEIREC